MSFKQIIVLSCVLFAALAECTISVGECPTLEIQKDFDASRYVGVWYEYAKTPYIFELGATCVKATYGALPDGKISVLNNSFNKLIGQAQEISGYAVQNGSGGNLTVTFPDSLGSPSAPYLVLATDYDSYSVVWSCTQVGPLRQDVAWVLTRAQSPFYKAVAAAKDELVRQNIPLGKITITDQFDCK